MQFQSERLTFSEYRASDFELFYSIFSHEQVMRYAWIDRFTSKEEIQPFFDQVLVNNKASEFRKAYEYAVYLKKDNIFIGFADIEIEYRNKRSIQGEIGYFILPDYWGCGYGTEIAMALLCFGFNELKLHRIVASCNCNNHNSEQIMKKVGMAKEGEFRKARYKDGKWDNELKYSILMEEWEHNIIK